jgi:hypothetical protein
MQFLVIYEKNLKENEIFINYCQWDGNEAELTKFMSLIDKADWSDFGGDLSIIYHGGENLIPEAAVNAHIRLDHPNDYMALFQKHTGKFECPFDVDEEEEEEYQDGKNIAFMVMDMFRGAYFGDLFRQ